MSFSFPSVDVRINRRLKYTYISLENDGTIRIKSPRKLSSWEIDTLLRKKADWIAKAQRKMRDKHANRLSFDKNGVVYLQGKAYRLHYRFASASALRFEEETCIYEAPVLDTARFSERLDAFYKEKAK
jgi:predicted metal-dependent hydrolase